MRYCLPLLCLVSFALGQESRQTSTYTYDLNGRRVSSDVTSSVKAAGDSSSATGVPNLNGRVSPLERVEEKVLRDDAGGRVIERIIRTYDQTGTPGHAQKVRIEESKNPDGSTNSVTTHYHGDLNGRFVLAERSRREASKSGDVEKSTVFVERPTVNSSLEIVERRQGTVRKSDKTTQEDFTTYRRDASGGFQVAARQVTERVEADSRVSEQTNEYIAGESGRLEFNGRVVSESEKRADGSETRQVSIYGTVAPGRAQTGEPQLREQQLIERRPGPGNSQVETFSIRRPALDDTTSLGQYQKISERVCAGDCNKK